VNIIIKKLRAYGLGRWRFYSCWLPVVGGWVTARSLCVQAVGGGLSGLAAKFSDDSALEVCIHVMRYTNRRLYFLLFVCVCVLVEHINHALSSLSAAVRTSDF